MKKDQKMSDELVLKAFNLGARFKINQLEVRKGGLPPPSRQSPFTFIEAKAAGVNHPS